MDVGTIVAAFSELLGTPQGVVWLIAGILWFVVGIGHG